jgi:hypothetical protein
MRHALSHVEQGQNSRYDGGVERVARGLVIAIAATLLFAIFAANRVLSHGSGTYVALVSFAPILLAPGALVWWKPQPRFLAVWSIWSFISSVIYLVGGSPYYYERELPDWPSVQWPSWIAIVLAIVGTSALAYLMAGKAHAPLPSTPRTRRIQQATRLSLALAVVTVLVTIIALHVPFAANFFNTAVIAFIVAPAPYVHRVARRSTAIMWAAWTSPFAAVMAILWFASTDHANELELPLRMWLLSYGTLMTMICVVTPLAAFLSSDEQSDLPTARVQ